MAILKKYFNKPRALSILKNVIEVRVNEHSDVNKQEHIKEHPNHIFMVSWDVSATVHSWMKRRITEKSYIARFHPELDKQVQSFQLTLLPMGIGVT
jgi:hypothetical protein